MSKFRLAPWQLSLAAAAFIVAASNNSLFAALADNPDIVSVQGVGFVVTLVLLMALVLNTIFLSVGYGWFQKAIIAVFLIATATISYFSNQVGVVFDSEMFLNILETIRDRNAAEAQELISLPLMLHVLLLGIFPSLLMAVVEVVPRRPLAEIRTRALCIVAGVVLLIGITTPNYKFVSYFAREHRDLQYTVTPIFSIMSLVQLVQDKLHHEPAFHVIDPNAHQLATGKKRTVGIMVIGETARADHFSLGGYLRNTNPKLGQADGVIYAHADSCGTSTLYSLPCMFSMRERSNYAPHFAAEESNVLDILTAAGVRIIWIDNNSSCKGVCARIENVNLRRDVDESSPFYTDAGYYDEILLADVDSYIDDDGSDVLIVLHSLGSHGPAYSRRYPPSFGVFAPFCDKASPTECTDGAVVNAYDNTILYADFFVNKVIEKLSARADVVDSFLFYASDHGESLGENGIYLHGLPYTIAPAAQTDVPFIFWFSPHFREQKGISRKMVHDIGSRHLSHDNISHSLLGFYNVSAGSYVPQLDIFASDPPALPMSL